MKLPHYLLATVLILPCLLAQTSASNIAGVWQGALVFGQGKVPVVFYLSPMRRGTYSGAMVDVASGTGSDIEITLTNKKVQIDLKGSDFKFDGTLASSGGEIEGKFTQGETSGTLTLTRSNDAASNIADSYEKHDYMVPMRDGIHLHTIVFSPKSRKEALPFLIERSPYGWDGAATDINRGMTELARDGYFLVFQDVRGRYTSEGQFILQHPIRGS